MRDDFSNFLKLQTEDETGEYVGKLERIESLDGTSIVDMEDPELRLFYGPKEFRVLNRAIVVHAEANGGARVMCCKIKSSSKEEVEEWYAEHYSSL